MGTEMSYGDYDFVPVPFLQMERQVQKSEDGQIVGLLWQMTLNGDLVAYPTSGIVNVDALQDDLEEATKDSGKHFLLTCDATTLLSCYPRINNLSFEAGNWVDRCKYTLAMEYDDTPSGINDYIESFSEEWTFEINRESLRFNWTLPDTTTENFPTEYTLNHNVTVKGKTIYDGSGVVKPAWEQARDFIVNNNILGINLAALVDKTEGVVGLGSGNLTVYNHYRTINQGERTGNYQVTENWVLLDGDASYAGATEDFTINLTGSTEDPINKVTIDGTIKGLEEISYSGSAYSVTNSRWDRANSYWDNVRSKLYQRCNLIFTNGVSDGIITSSRSLNPTAMNLSTGNNPKAGTISYNYEFNDRPINCFPNARSEKITITENNPVDVFASIFVLGKASGPVLQDLGTVSEGTRNLSVDVVLEPITICPTSIANVSSLLAPFGDVYVEGLVNLFTAELESNYDAVFISENQKTWSPRDGRYSRSVTWTYSGC